MPSNAFTPAGIHRIVSAALTVIFARNNQHHDTLCLIPYHKYWVTGGDGKPVRNPDFGVDCGRMLDLKSPDNRQKFSAAVVHFGKMLAVNLKEHPPLANAQKFEIAIIPKSEQGKISPGLQSVALKLCDYDRRFSLPKAPILTRTRTIEKLSNGGNRATSVHRDSIKAEIHKNRWDQPVLLLDDVATTGNSIIACTELLYQAGASLVVPVVLGRTQQ